MEVSAGAPNASIEMVDLNSDDRSEIVAISSEQGVLRVIANQTDRPLPMVEVSAEKNNGLKFTALTEVPVAKWNWQLRKDGVWINASTIEGVKGGDEFKVTLNRKIGKDYDAIRVEIEDRNCRQLYLSAPKMLNLSENLEFSLGPNPSSNVAYISWQDRHSDPCTVVIQDATGRIVYEMVLTSIDHTRPPIDVGEWRAGVYYVQMTVAGTTKTQKLVVE